MADAGVRSKLTLLGDAPYAGDADPLEFARLAKELRELVIGSAGSTPFSIGIEAPWGMGKSTLMQRLKSQLDGVDDVVTVWFNAWSAENADVLEGLIKTALANVDQGVLLRVARNEKFLRGLRLTTSLGAAVFRSGDVVDRLWERFASDPKARNDIRVLVNEVMNAWQKKGGRSGGKLMVIFIDDLDRCSPETVFHLFEAIKVYLDAPGFVFVIGFDELVISDAILEQKKFSKSITSKHYLEKIIQISYRVPRPEEKQISDLFDVYAETSGTSDLFDEPGREIVVQGSARNPRKIKRFINSFILDYQSDPQWDELGPTLLIKWLILHMYFGEFARLFADEGRDWIEEFLAYYDLWIADRAGAEGPATTLLTERYGLPPNADLATIQRSLPEVFQTLVVKRSFVAFLEEFRDEEARGPLVRKLRSEPYRRAAEPQAAEMHAGARSLEGLRILIVGGDTVAVDLMLAIRALGGLPSTTSAERVKHAHLARPDVIVWTGDVERGLVEIERLRSTGPYRGPIILLGRITPEWRERAEALDAFLAPEPVHVLELLDGLAAARETWDTQTGTPSSAPRYS